MSEAFARRLTGRLHTYVYKKQRDVMSVSDSDGEPDAGVASSSGEVSRQASEALDRVDYEVRRTFAHIAPQFGDLDSRTVRTA